MFVEYHDLVHIIPLHPLVTDPLGLSKLFTFRVEGLDSFYNNNARLKRVKGATRRWSWFVSDALPVFSVLVAELDITLGTLEGHTASHTAGVHLAVLEHLSATTENLNLCLGGSRPA